jgi:hypothetical protein
MSETPRADAARIVAYGEGGIENGVGFSCVPLKEVRQLERELNEALERERVAIASWDEERQRASREGERVIEANADRLRLRKALAQAGAGQFLDTISATPPQTVVAKADADALREVIAKVAENLRNAVRESHDIGDSYIAGTASELEKTLETYRAKYPTA